MDGSEGRQVSWYTQSWENTQRVAGTLSPWNTHSGNRLDYTCTQFLGKHTEERLAFSVLGKRRGKIHNGKTG